MVTKAPEKKYLTYDDLKVLQVIDVKPEDLISADNIDEEALLNKFLTFEKNDQELLLKAAIQLAIVGYGNKNYGAVRDNDGNVIAIEDLFKRLNIKLYESRNAKYDKDELSARRLIRLCRYQIANFILSTGRTSFLWNKYADKTIKEYASFCFPLGEHLVKTHEEALFLYNTYKTVDIQLNTEFCSRLERVLVARGVFNPLITKNL